MSKRKRPRKFKAKFENGGFWEYYKDLERQFEDFLEYVPYLDINERVCSFRLVNLLLSIGGHTDSAFKEMAAYRRFSKNEKCNAIRKKVKESRKRIKLGERPIIVSIKEFLSAFEDIYKLSKREVIFKRLPEREKIVPFRPHNPKTNAPEWWDIYNGLKHDFSNNFEKANLQITKDALAGAFLLNARHIPSAVRLCYYGILKGKMRAKEGLRFRGTIDIRSRDVRSFLERKQAYPAITETPLFIYDYDQ